MTSPTDTVSTADIAIVAPAFDNRDAFSETLTEMARADKRIVAVCNDSVGSSKLVAFRAEFPDRLINVGIAEQNMIGVGAGLAASGFIPFVCGAAPFLTGRGLEQIKADVAYSQHAVILCGMSPGLRLRRARPDPPFDRRPVVAAAPCPASTSSFQPTVIRHAGRSRWSPPIPRPTYIRVGRFPVPDVSAPTGCSSEDG